MRRKRQLLFQARGYEVRAYRSGKGLAGDPEALRADCLLAAGGDALCLPERLRAAGWAGRAVLICGDCGESAAACGYDLVLAKPVADAELAGGLARLISSARSRPAPAPAGSSG
jgi:hypothetical protein